MKPVLPHRLTQPRAGRRGEVAGDRRFARGTQGVPSITSDGGRLARPSPGGPRIGLAGLWGVLGILALLIDAMVRLIPNALAPIERGELTGVHTAVLAAWTAVAAYCEGYRGFQRAFAPRAVARAQALSTEPSPLAAMLAPLYCMGLFRATPRRMIGSWLLTATIVGLVVIVDRVPQPWQGIIDFGVVTGLVWGSLALIYFLRGALRGEAMPVPADLPTDAS